MCYVLERRRGKNHRQNQRHDFTHARGCAHAQKKRKKWALLHMHQIVQETVVEEQEEEEDRWKELGKQ